MPTVFRSGPYRFFFYSADRAEPPHIHVERDESAAKFWLIPVRLEYNQDFAAFEILRLEALIENNLPLLLRAWDEFFAD
jgi:hypothetical protein